MKNKITLDTYLYLLSFILILYHAQDYNSSIIDKNIKEYENNSWKGLTHEFNSCIIIINRRWENEIYT